MTFIKFAFSSFLGIALSLPAGADARANPPESMISPERPAYFLNATATAGSELEAGARQFIDSMSQTALGFLADNAMSREKKTEEFTRLLESSFDMETIGRFAMGRHWQVATPEQRKEYQSLFRRMVIRVYSDKFHEYKGQRFVTRSVRAENDKDIIVTSFIIPETGPEIQVDWRVRYKKGNYRIVDVIVEGVSMTIMQRSDFSSVIQRGGGNVSVLLDYLRNAVSSP